jgi:hypothetical protein
MEPGKCCADCAASASTWKIRWSVAPSLLAAGEHGSDAARAGIEYLLATQDGDGNWSEEPFTGTGFPKVFYLKYHLYRLYFPLMALARYEQAIGNQQSAISRKSDLPEPVVSTGYRYPPEET